MSGLEINNCGIGIDMSNGGASDQTVGSVMLIDSTISNTPIGVSTVYSTNEGATNGTLIIDNVDMSNNGTCSPGRLVFSRIVPGAANMILKHAHIPRRDL